MAGQAFQQSFAGLSSPTYGTITFGRQNTLLADGISKYDPAGASQAFSVIGLSGTAAGAGDTEERRLDNSLKYTNKIDMVHVGLMYRFANGSAEDYRNGGGSGEAFTVVEGQTWAPITPDSRSMPTTSMRRMPWPHPRSAPRRIPGCWPPATRRATCSAGTISDNKSYSIMASYDFGGPKVFAGWEHIEFDNPSIPLPGRLQHRGRLRDRRPEQ